MIDKKQIEVFYDYFDLVANILYEHNKMNYIEGMNQAFSMLLDQDIKLDLPESEIERIVQVKSTVEARRFQPEEIRKAVQLGILKGLKHAYLSNALMTPDTIGLFMAYLIDKLYDDVTNIKTILDPMIGTGNLVYTVMNQLKSDATVYGVDHHITHCELARNFGDVLSIKNQVFYQDTLQYYGEGFDLVISDLAISSEKVPYLPYQVVNHHISSLKNGNYMLILIENDFFEQEQSAIFRTEIMKHARIFGLIKLNENMFSKHPKSILILKKVNQNSNQDQEKFLLVDCPSFNDKEAFSKTIQNIDQWFLTRKGH
jgi:site-specific DNA-methyltransferase (adenine-specific)